MQQIIRKHIMTKALSDKEILQLVQGRARLITHDEIAKFKNIDDLLGGHHACIILYCTAIRPDNSVYGHWCCVFRAEWDPTGKTISYFDPYGEPPDVTLEFMSDEAIKEFGNENILSQLLIRSAEPVKKGGNGYCIVYNTCPLQAHKKGDAICGRLTGLRLQSRQVDGNTFAKYMKSYPGLSSDDLTCLLTAFIDPDARGAEVAGDYSTGILLKR